MALIIETLLSTGPLPTPPERAVRACLEVKKLANVYKDKEIGECLASAQRIHANLFHDFMDELTFEDDKQRTEKLLETLVKILDRELKRG